MRYLARRRGPIVIPALLLLASFSLLPAGAVAAAATCQPGQHQPSSEALVTFLEAGMKFYTLLNPATCGTCSTPPGLSLTAANVGMTICAGCDLVLRVSVIGWIGSSSCPQPYPAAVKCGPVDYSLSGGSGADSTYVLPLPDSCCIAQRAFLCVEVLEATPNQFFRLRVSGTSCTSCVQRWGANYLPTGAWDLCHATYGFGRNLAMWADADCCPLVPAVRPSWGSLKVLYR
jgi:hypothetical protein